MAVTGLSVLGTPGGRRTFSAKSATSTAHTGLFTELSPTATPGKRHTFSAKTPGGGGGIHTGLFTDLSVMAVPGRRRSFSAKTTAIEEVIEKSRGYDYFHEAEKRQILLREDEELLLMIQAFLTCH